MIRSFLLMLAALTPQQSAIRALSDQDLRVAMLGDRLARTATALCPGQVAGPGWVVQDAAQYAAGGREAARVVLGLGDGPTIVGIATGSAAAHAGLRQGDTIVAVDGRSVMVSMAHDPYARVAEVEDAIEGKQSVTLTLRRDGGPLVVRYNSAPGCASRFQIVPGTSLNARADGRYVQLNVAMVDFASSDDELAVVVAHEFAHNILRHKARHIASKEAEYQADRLGVWLMARAGYDIDAVVPFWTRLGKRTGLGILSDGSHPRWRERVVAVGQAVAEVKAQRAAGQPLIPPAQ